jgi:hypothetical protein
MMSFSAIQLCINYDVSVKYSFGRVVNTRKVILNIYIYNKQDNIKYKTDFVQNPIS